MAFKGSEVANTIMQNIMWTKNPALRKQLSRTHLHKLVPTSGHDDGVLRIGAEAHARHPLGVALVGDGVLAVSEGVPQLDGAVTRGGDNLAVVSGEGDGEDIVGVANEGTGGNTGRELPQTQGLVPGSGQRVGTVRGDDLRRQQSAIYILPNLSQKKGSQNVHSRRRCGSGP